MGHGQQRLRELLSKACRMDGSDSKASDLLNGLQGDVLEEWWRLIEREIAATERARASRLLDSTKQQLRLAAGELTTREVLAIEAVLAWKKKLIVGDEVHTGQREVGCFGG